MTSFFRLRSAHGSTIALDLRLEALTAAAAPLPLGTVPVLAYRLRSCPTVIILTAEAQKAWRFHLYPLSDRRSAIMVFRSIGDRSIALMHPFSGKFVTATPDLNAPLHNTAEQVRAWEWFTLEPLESSALPDGVERRLEKAEQLLAAPLTNERLSEFLAQGSEFADTLNAALPLMPTPVIDDFARLLLGNPTSRQLLARAFLSDVWANAALPDLASWLEKRTPALALHVEPHATPAQPLEQDAFARAHWAGSSSLSDRTIQTPGNSVFGHRALRLVSRWLRRPAPLPSPLLPAVPEPPRRRSIGPELDSLGTSGLTGGFISFPHACVLRGRRDVTPRKRIAVVATARNEGIYLLEWIAHHRLLGVEDFFIYSNDNDDGSDELLAALADARLITWISSRLDPAVGNAQFKAYGHALSYMPDLLDFQWALVIDLDEYLILDRGVFFDIGAFCDWHRDRGAETVATNWAFFRSEELPASSQIPLPSRNQRLLTAAEMGEGVRLVKSMSRPNRVCHSEAHVPFTDERSGLVHFHGGGQPHKWHNPATGFAPSPKFSDIISDDVAVIHHYIFKSPEEWLWKNARNPGDHRLTSNAAFEPVDQSRVRSFLAQHDASDLVMTRRATDCVPGLVDEIKRLKSLPGIEALYLNVMSRYEEKLSRIRSAYARSPIVQGWDGDAKRFLDLASIR